MIMHDLIVCGTITTISMLVGLFAVILIRENKDRPVLPWARRMAVERAKATTEIQKESLEQDALEIKRMALDHRRTEMLKVMQLEQGEEAVQKTAMLALGEGSGNGEPQTAFFTDKL